jgi:hypothetical protein
MTFEDFLTHFERVNLLQVRQDTKEKGFEFDRAAAIIAGRILVERVKPGQIVLLLGKRVADAIGVVNDYFMPCVVNNVEFYVLPHPSGVNRWWNNPDNLKQACAFLRGVVERTR